MKPGPGAYERIIKIDKPLARLRRENKRNCAKNWIKI